jgi:hypothetical protein
MFILLFDGRPLRIQRDAFRAQGTGTGFPDPTGKRRERLKGEMMCCRQFTGCLAVDRERSDSNRLRTALL